MPRLSLRGSAAGKDAPQQQPTASAEKSPAVKGGGGGDMRTRTLTVVSLGPALFVSVLYSPESCLVMIFLGVFIAGIEWSGLKRHLKVALLLWGGQGGGGGYPRDFHLLYPSCPTASGGRASHAISIPPSPPPQQPTTPAPHDDDDDDDKESAATAASATHQQLLVPSPPMSPLLPTGEPLRPEEYPLPVGPVSFYNVLKHVGWAGLAVAAYMGIGAFLVALVAYFLIFVCVTFMAHNRVGIKVGKAVSHLSRLQPRNGNSNSGGNDSSTSGGGDGGGGDEDDEKTGAAKRPAYSSPEDARRAVKAAQRDYFHSLELHMIAERQPTEQLLDFCLDIFGILWVSGLVYPLFYYKVPGVGRTWGFATLLGNFMNDVTALLVGRSLKKMRARYAGEYDVPSLRIDPNRPAATTNSNNQTSNSPISTAPTTAPTIITNRSAAKAKLSDCDDAESGADDDDDVDGGGAAATSKGSGGSSRAKSRGATATSTTATTTTATRRLKHVSEAPSAILRLVLRGPHSLSAISPNKSIEGAVAGVLTNSVGFAGSMCFCYYVIGVPLPAPDFIAPRFNSVPVWLLTGLVMGILGVVGDLLQSLLKRVARVKDAGFIVPGHGGILDRLDGALLVFPFMFILISVFHALS